MDQTEHNSPLDPDSRQADDRLVHALLLHLHDLRAGERREQRVSGVMRAIAGTVQVEPNGVTGSRPAWYRLWARRGSWAAAATIVIIVGTFLMLSSQAPALASLNDVLGALSLPGDRTFRIEVQSAPVADPDSGENPVEQQGRPGLNGAMLYLRDGRQYLLIRKDPRGGELFDGFDGRQSWRVRTGALVESREGPGAGGLPVPMLMANVPFADLQSTLQHIRTDYTVERFQPAPLLSGGDSGLYLLARRNSREVKGPETIEIWANSQTGMPKKIVFDRAKFQGSPSPRRLTFELVGEQPLPADWFSHTSHLP